MDAILEATAQVLVHDGYDKTSTNRVASRAGVSVGSVYQYFPNKEALVGELVDRYSRLVTDMILAQLLELVDEPPEVVVSALVEAMIELKRRDPQLAMVLRQQIPRVGRMQRYETQLHQIVDAAAIYLERWKHRLRHEDVKTAAFVGVHAVDAATHAGVTMKGAEDDEKLALNVTDMLVRYLVVDAELG